MWSVPVHRWLSMCVHWPILKATSKNKSNGTSGWFIAVLTTFVVSTVFHEAVLYVAMRGTCWPFNTFLITVAALLALSWDVVFPIKKKQQLLSNPPVVPAVSGGNGGGDASTGGGTGASLGAGDGSVQCVSPFGQRGMASAVTFCVLVQLSPLICDGVAWLWWRSVFMS